MSSFIVSSETINRVVHLLDKADYRQLGHGADWCDDIGNRLWKLNHAAYDCRYSKEPEEQFERFCWSPRNYTTFQMIKAADCWIYQCSEGEQFEADSIYKLVEQERDKVVRQIVSAMPEYDAAEWDTPHNQLCVTTNPIVMRDQ